VPTSDLTIVVPVRDRPGQLERCQEAIACTVPEAAVVVVDDGSVAPVRVPSARGGRVRVIRHPTARGAAAARNSGLRACSTAFVGFVDSDVVLPESAAARLLAHLVDPRLGAVAPRVRALSDRGPVAAYEARHSALDMGPVGGLVSPGRPIPYVPSAVLFGRRAALDGGFDEALLIGEDVDLVWRLGAAGWGVRYAADIEVLHDHPVRLSRLVARRYLYASSVGLLAQRHPEALPAVRLTPQAALLWILALSGFRRASAAVAIISVGRTAARLRRVSAPPPGLALSVTARGLAGSAVGLSRAVLRAWSPPLLIMATRSPRARRAIGAAFAVRVIEDALAAGSPRAAVRDAPLRVVDELVAAAGTWCGCSRARTLRPLLPSFQPPRGRVR
jgi:mycofactocin system glycosyltransferase